MNYLILSLCIPLLASCTLTSEYPMGQNMQRPTISGTGVMQASIVSTGSLTEEQKAILQDAYSEELLARDIYTYMVSKYPNLTEVTNIIASEEQHRESVGNLLDNYGLTRPTDYRIYTETYTTLKNMIDSSLTGAIEVGIMVETGDINHLLEEYKKIENTDIRRVFENIGGGSFNHLRAFLREAQSVGYTPQTDSSKYLSESDLTTSGPLHRKMTELLIAKNLPVAWVSNGGGHRRGIWNGGHR